MRKPFIAGNWKMNNGIKESIELVKNLREKELDSSVEVCLCVPFIDIESVKREVASYDISVGAQNMYFKENGAYTGEISPKMLKDAGVKYVILGHSERREYFKEDDELINKKLLRAFEYGLKPILCVGETLEEREEGKEKEKVKNQIDKDLKDLSDEEVKNLVIAYEPIWAIGTGKTASKEDAEEMCAYIRQLIKEKNGNEVGEEIRIQYGGSVKPNNIKEIMSEENIDGALVGGASLDADSFEALVNYKENN